MPATSLENVGPKVITGKPFSAKRYSHIVRSLPDGRKEFIRNEIYPFDVGRAADGRIRIQIVGGYSPECNRLELLFPPPCPSWSIVVFDPSTKLATGWTEGEIGAHGAVVTRMSESQAETIESLTSVIPPTSTSPPNGSAAGVTTENLGEKDIDGVRATGVRTTFVFPSTYSGNKMPKTRIYEVWKSEELRVVVKIIEGDPKGQERISGLEEISLHPDSGLFHPPDDYEIQYHFFNLSSDIERLNGWYPR